jgi:hypothetical protein
VVDLVSSGLLRVSFCRCRIDSARRELSRWESLGPNPILIFVLFFCAFGLLLLALFGQLIVCSACVLASESPDSVFPVRCFSQAVFRASENCSNLLPRCSSYWHCWALLTCRPVRQGRSCLQGLILLSLGNLGPFSSSPVSHLCAAASSCSFSCRV